MNKIMKGNYGIFSYYQALRNQLMDLLDDEDLAFRLQGETESLGALCKEIGETQTSYIQSFKSFSQNFDYRNDDPALANRVAKLIAWYAQLDKELKETIAAFSDEDIETKRVDRGGGFVIPILFQLEVYKEALLIFYGKVSVYLKAMNKPRPEQWQEWIG